MRKEEKYIKKKGPGKIGENFNVSHSPSLLLLCTQHPLVNNAIFECGELERDKN